MLPDERMVEAAWVELFVRPYEGHPSHKQTQRALDAAFAALDRVALIEAGASGDTLGWGILERHTETERRVIAAAVLRAVGLIA